MGGAKTVISQGAFDELVHENIDDLGMDPAEALQDAIETLTLQGADLSGIITLPSSLPHPILTSLHHLAALTSSPAFQEDDLRPLLHDFVRLVQGSDDAAIATRNGAVELLTSVCSNLSDSQLRLSGLQALCCLLCDVAAREAFERCGGPAVIVRFLQESSDDAVSNACFAVIAAAATGTEILKESFLNLKVDEFILKALHNSCGAHAGPAVYDATRVLLTADDSRVAASQVFGYARRFAKTGIAEALVRSLQQGIASLTLVPACLALKAVAVNDDICRAVADKGAIDAVLQCIDDSAYHFNKPVALASSSLLSKLAGSDQNKSTIVGKRGMDKLVGLSARFAEDPSVIQEAMSIISVLSLRCPDHASRAMEAGAGDLAIQSMQKFPASQQLQTNACLMIRNLVVRNQENRKILLDNGIEKMIRKARESHKNCRNAATDALRDLGLANYNS